MPHPNPETVTLNDILITEELSRRASRTPNLQAENQAMRMLIHRMTHEADSLMQTLVETALELCQAGTTGLSVLELSADGEEIFRWNALAGTLAHQVGGSTPRNFSPCGVCLDQGSPVLFSHPERYFTYFQETNTPIVEGLVVPLVTDRHVFGTIWIMSHDEGRQFDSEDVRIMTSLADFTATALLLQQRQTGELLAANAVLETEIVERKQIEAQTHALIENLPGGAVFVVDRNLRYLLAEGEALSVAGFSSEDFVGRTIFEVLPPDLAANHAPMYRQALADEPFEHEHNAHNHTYLSRGTPLRSPDGEVYAVLAVSFDITERKRVEEERQRAEATLRKLEERQAFLLTLSDALRSLADPVEIQETVTRTAMHHFGADRCYYCEIKDGNAIILRDAARGDLPSVAGVYPLSRFPLLQAVIHSGRPLVIQDVHTTDTVDEDLRQLCIQLQVISYIDVPVIKQGKPVGVLCLVQSTPRDWTDLEVDLAIETADRIWEAVERAHAEAALREAEIQRVREQAAREQERQRAESLAELDRAKTSFFSNVSHEFRTPLTLLLAPLQDALKTVDEWMSDGVEGWRGGGGHENPSTPPPISPSTLKHNLELVHRNSLRLLKLVNTLLDFSRIEAGRIEAVYEPTDLATFTAELASVFRSVIERAGLQLMVDCPPLPDLVYVDREMWEKIVLNLLSNAFKFTFEGEIRVSLRVGERESGSVDEQPSTHRPIDPSTQVILQICDTGTGIAPEHLPHLFERFYQVRGTQARTHDGSGIGLALVYELVRLHGGTIEVSSTVAEGTCFTIAIPFGTDHLPPDHLHVEGEHNQPTRTLTSTAMGATSYGEEAERWLPEARRSVPDLPSPDRPIAPSPQHVLVIDDNADMREYLTRILSDYVQVDAIADGATALTVAQERVPDLILSDVMMPGLDGFQLLGTLRADPRTREIPIILLSARAGEEAIVEGLEAGADDYLSKPFSAQELVSRVTAHLQMAQLRSEALQQERIINRQKDELISVVSHELNTPLVSILGWTRMLRSNPPNPVMLSKALDTIERNAMLQAKLVQDLLDLSRITAGKFRLNSQPIELQPVIETAIATVTQTAADKNIRLTWQETVVEPVVVMGDGDRLSQVLINLLTNAIKFTPESGSIALELLVKSGSGGEWMSGSVDVHPSTHSPIHPPIHSYAEIRVTDTGHGIPADFLPHVFDRFRQAESVNSAKGLGLGLAIARHIVELHNGTIHAENTEEGQGAAFTVRLPLLHDGNELSQ